MTQAKELTEAEMKRLLAVIADDRPRERNRLAQMPSHLAGLRRGRLELGQPCSPAVFEGQPAHLPAALGRAIGRFRSPRRVPTWRSSGAAQLGDRQTQSAGQACDRRDTGDRRAHPRHRHREPRRHAAVSLSK